MLEEHTRVMVVDDEEKVRNTLKRVLVEVGYDVAVAADGEGALYEISQHGADVVLLDIKMPGISGMDLLGTLAAKSPETGIIMMTGIHDVDTATEAMKKGADDYVTKPFDIDDMLLRMESAMDKRRALLNREAYVQELRCGATEQSEKTQGQFEELIQALAREQKLLLALASVYKGNTKKLVSKLPSELQESVRSFEEFRDALLRILKQKSS